MTPLLLKIVKAMELLTQSAKTTTEVTTLLIRLQATPAHSLLKKLPELLSPSIRLILNSQPVQKALSAKRVSNLQWFVRSELVLVIQSSPLKPLTVIISKSLLQKVMSARLTLNPVKLLHLLMRLPALILSLVLLKLILSILVKSVNMQLTKMTR